MGGPHEAGTKRCFLLYRGFFFFYPSASFLLALLRIQGIVTNTRVRVDDGAVGCVVGPRKAGLETTAPRHRQARRGLSSTQQANPHPRGPFPPYHDRGHDRVTLCCAPCHAAGRFRRPAAQSALVCLAWGFPLFVDSDKVPSWFRHPCRDSCVWVLCSSMCLTGHGPSRLAVLVDRFKSRLISTFLTESVRL